MLYHKQNYNLNQTGTYTIHAVIPKKYHKYPSATIHKHVNVLSEVNKFHNVHVLNMTQLNKCTVLKPIPPSCVCVEPLIHQGCIR